MIDTLTMAELEQAVDEALEKRRQWERLRRRELELAHQMDGIAMGFINVSRLMRAVESVVYPETPSALRQAKDILRQAPKEVKP
jgi:hypothetical protein